MLWELEYADKEFALDQHWAQGVPLNHGLQQFVDAEPELEDFEGFYLQAFWRLVTERGGGNCIPYSRIMEYGTNAGLDSAMIETFLVIIWGLDRAYMDWADAKRESRKPPTK